MPHKIVCLVLSTCAETWQYIAFDTLLQIDNSAEYGSRCSCCFFHAVQDGDIRVIAEPEVAPEDLYGGKD